MSKKQPRHSEDFLDEIVRESTAETPEFPALLAAARRRRELAKQATAERQKRKLSQTQIAARMKTSQAIVSRIENGGDVKLSTLERYLAAIGLDIRFDLHPSRARHA